MLMLGIESSGDETDVALHGCTLADLDRMLIGRILAVDGGRSAKL